MHFLEIFIFILYPDIFILKHTFTYKVIKLIKKIANFFFRKKTTKEN